MTTHLRIWFPLTAFGLSLLDACVPIDPGPETPTNAITPDTHTQKFPITSGKHAGDDCNSCHGDFDTFTQFSCTGCHAHDQAPMNARHGAMAGYGYNSASCYACHPQGWANAIDHTPNFPIAPTDVHNRSVAACTSCHTNLSTPNDVTTISCIGCHNNNTAPPLPVDVGGVNSRHSPPVTPVTIAGYAFDSSSPAAQVATNGLCLKCHAATIATPTWTNPLKFPLTQHDSLCFNVTLGSHIVSRTIGNTPYCFKCHDTINATSKPWGVDWSAANCTACHGARGNVPACR